MTLSSFFDYSTYHPLNYIFSVLILIIYYRNVAKKFQQLGEYYLAFQEYTLNSHLILKKINPMLLLSFEFMVIPMLIFPGSVRFASLLVVLIQLIYILFMFSGKKNITELNCGCYVNLPYEVSFITVLKNISILFLGLFNLLIFYLFL